jgi:hypothetical protein
MNIQIMLNGSDVTDQCLLTATKITYDSTKRITTASITIAGVALNRASMYDYAHYDQDKYSVAIREMYEVIIYDGRDGVTKLFDGQIYAMTMAQTDSVGPTVFYQCDLNDWAAYLDRSVCWDTSFVAPLPGSDAQIITALITQFCPKIKLADIATIVPQIQAFDWATKTCRQVLDDMTTLSMGSWRVDFDGYLHYYLASAAPSAPFGLSTSPDYVNTFPVKVDSYKHDFTNPINRAYVRGNVIDQGVTVEADYADPVSIQTYGEYAYGIVDTQIATGYDASLKAKSIVLTNAYPIETGNFTIWGKDGLQCGMQVHLHEDNIGIDGDYTIIALTMQWVDPWTVQYAAQFGSAKPDLETILRLLNQRTMWATSVLPVSAVIPGPPAPGTVTDASIAAGGLSANVINSVNVNTIVGKIQAGQIDTVNAGQIAGSIQAGQIATVSAGSIQGYISAGNINAVNATSIQGVVVSSQLADGIVDTLAKYATAIRPIQMIKAGDPWPPAMPNKNFPPGAFFYYQPDGHFYQVTADGLGWVQNDSPAGSLMSFYYIGAINAQSIIGLIAAGQIGSITAGQITGQIQAGQIAAVNASAITGKIGAGQIASVASNTIQGLIEGNQIDKIDASQISGSITAGQIGSINAATITIGVITAAQIGSVNGQTINVGSVTSDKFNGYSIDVGGWQSMPGRIRVFNNGGAVVAQMGVLNEVGVAAYGGWFQVWGAGGTAYSNAPIYTDTAGNLHIVSANLSGANLTNSTITGGSVTNSNLNINGQIITGPQTFDSTYGSLALQNKQEPDTASLVSRGLVLYYNDQVVGSFVRSPYGGYASLELLGSGGYILAIGGPATSTTGYIRSDGGYRVASQIGRTVTLNIGGTILNFAGGILVP